MCSTSYWIVGCAWFFTWLHRVLWKPLHSHDCMLFFLVESLTSFVLSIKESFGLMGFHFYYQRVIGYKQVQIVLGQVEFSRVSHWLFFFNPFHTPKQTNSIPSASVQVRYLFIFTLFFFLVKMKETLTISMHHRRTSTYLSTSRAYVPLVHKFAPEREPKENCTSWWNEG